MLGEHVFGYQNSLWIGSKLVHQHAQLLRGEVTLPVGGRGKGQAVDGEEGSLQAAARDNGCKFIAPYAGCRFDTGKGQMIFDGTEGVHGVGRVFVEGCAQLNQVHVRADLVMDLFIELAVECARQGCGEGGEAKSQHQQDQWRAVERGCPLEVAGCHQQADTFRRP